MVSCPVLNSKWGWDKTSYLHECYSWSFEGFYDTFWSYLRSVTLLSSLSPSHPTDVACTCKSSIQIFQIVSVCKRTNGWLVPSLWFNFLASVQTSLIWIEEKNNEIVEDAEEKIEFKIVNHFYIWLLLTMTTIKRWWCWWNWICWIYSSNWTRIRIGYSSNHSYSFLIFLPFQYIAARISSCLFFISLPTAVAQLEMNPWKYGGVIEVEY